MIINSLKISIPTRNSNLLLSDFLRQQQQVAYLENSLKCLYCCTVVWIVMIINQSVLFIKDINPNKKQLAYLENSLKCLYWCRSTFAEGLNSFTCNKIFGHFETLAMNRKMFSYDISIFWNIGNELQKFHMIILRHLMVSGASSFFPINGGENADVVVANLF